MAAKHPTIDAEACWPVYIDNCERRGLPPSKISFGEWLGMEKVHVKKPPTMPKPVPSAEDVPAGWEDTDAYKDSVFAIADGMLFADRWEKLSPECREAIMAELAAPSPPAPS